MITIKTPPSSSMRKFFTSNIILDRPGKLCFGGTGLTGLSVGSVWLGGSGLALGMS
jgi:hypothetical protein